MALSNTSKDEQMKYVSHVTNLINLTMSGKIQWREEFSSDLAAPGSSIAETVYRADHNNVTISLYHKSTQRRSFSHSPSLFLEIKKNDRPSDKHIVPPSGMLKDLYRAIRRQILNDVNKLLDDFLEGEALSA